MGYRDRWVYALLAASAFALYFRTMSPTVLDGDSGEYQHMAYYLGVPHSTGYPLYILLAKLFTWLPVGDVAYRVNLFSVVAAALVPPVVYAIARRLIRQRVPALLAAFALIVTPSLWGAAAQAEVYALHLLIGALALFCALRWYQDGAPRDFYALALTCGFGLTHHRVFVFLAPALALIVWFNRARVTRAMFGRGALLVLLPLILYAYIPIRANQLIAQQSPVNWDLYPREDAMVKGTVSAYYNNTLYGFFNLVTGFDNRNKLGFKSPLDEADRLNLATTLLLDQFTLVGIVIAALGAWQSFKRNRREFLFLLVAGAGVGFIAIYLRGTSTVYYFSLAYLVVALWIGFGADAIIRFAARVPIKHFTRAPALALSLVPLTVLVLHFSEMDQSQYYLARDNAQAVLRDNLAPNAVVIAPWEVSEPMRYYQFVENQRPDLLVVNISPIWPQFERLMKRARELNRPFYFVEFNPELRSTPGPRSVQAVPLPLLNAPQPRYALHDARIVPEVDILGYDLDPDPPQPGKPTRVLVYYRANARMYPMYSSLLGVNDLTGKPWSDYPGFPASFYFPTYRWQAGDYYRDAFTVNLPADAPAGLYNLDLYWYVYDLDTRKPDYNRESRVALGEIRVGDFTTANISHANIMRVGPAIAFLGWSSAPATNSNTLDLARGQSLALDLYWRAVREPNEAYTVFVHLVDANGRVVADADAPPLSGLYPTNRWRTGEPLRDRHTLKIPADLAPGNYTIAIGMYLPATGARLPIGITNVADSLGLTQVVVR
ncbi:MAG: DUF2723 domain-containing protein [Chloroflexi bacterium]|nr:DUF2723 domain-containing protein [Chloroflexota bacterium]